eukprot:GHVH01007667.1.p1 GENE.GHVH01007667.1~~GHVH01007667.1.p1  ORF type:complete len:273 (-),score=28.07 GHVH01007667.1:793-1611(-)
MMLQKHSIIIRLSANQHCSRTYNSFKVDHDSEPQLILNDDVEKEHTVKAMLLNNNIEKFTELFAKHLQHLPPSIKLASISTGGNHSMILLVENRIFLPVDRQKARVMSDHAQMPYKSYVVGWGNNDHFQLGSSSNYNPSKALISAIGGLNVANKGLMIDEARGPSCLVPGVKTIEFKRTDGSTTNFIEEVYCGSGFSVAIERSPSGTFVWTWGNNSNGQCGHGKNQLVIDRPTLLSPFNQIDFAVSHISVSAHHTLLVSVSRAVAGSVIFRR